MTVLYIEEEIKDCQCEEEDCDCDGECDCICECKECDPWDNNREECDEKL